MGRFLFRPGIDSHECRFSRPPSRWQEQGTVWQCDCGRVWVATVDMAGYSRWRRESKRERERRLKRVNP